MVRCRRRSRAAPYLSPAHHNNVVLAALLNDMPGQASSMPDAARPGSSRYGDRPAAGPVIVVVRLLRSSSDHFFQPQMPSSKITLPTSSQRIDTSGFALQALRLEVERGVRRNPTAQRMQPARVAGLRLHGHLICAPILAHERTGRR